MLLNTSKTKDFHIGEVFWFQEMTKKNRQFKSRGRLYLTTNDREYLK